MAFSIFMAPAIWNGFPLIFTDSLSYLTSGIELVASVDRPIFYGIFTRLSNLIFEIWGLIFLQSALVIFLLLKFADTISPDLSKGVILIWICLIGLMTSVPWFTSQISADIFTACLFLTMTILALKCEKISTKNAVFLGGLIVFEVSMHSGNLMIGFLLLLCIVMLLYLQMKSWNCIKKFLLITITSLSISFVAIVVSNAIFQQGITFNRWGKVIFLARILEDGPGLRYLNEICVAGDKKTCAALPLFNEAAKKEIDLGLTENPELKNLVLNALLWDGGINSAGGLAVVNSEASAIIYGAFKAYPIQMSAAFVKNSIDQFKTFTVGNQFGSTIHIATMNNFFKNNFPFNYKNYTQSQQSMGRVDSVINTLNPIYSAVVVIGGSFILALAFISHKRQAYGVGYCRNSSVQLIILSLFGFLIINAMITGGISAVFDRYQSRIIWLLPAVSLFFMIEVLVQRFTKSSNSFS